MALLIEWKRMFSSEGRQSRRGHVVIVVGSVVFAIGLFALTMLVVPDEKLAMPAVAFCARILKIFCFVFYLFVMPVIIAFSAVKRLHDLGRGGSYFLYYFIPVVNAAFAFWLLTQRGDEGENAYGAPKT